MGHPALLPIRTVGVLRIFITLKNPSPWTVFNPQPFSPVASTLTTTPPRWQCNVWLQTGQPGDWGLIPGSGKRIFPLASVSRQALGLAHPPVQWVPGVLSLGLKCGRSMMLTTHPHPVPMSRMSKSYNSSPPSASMACSGTALAF
jgi:hypothetical protein